MFMRIQKKKDKDGSLRYYASVVRSDRIKGKVVQSTVAYLGVVTESQVPYLKAAYAKHKPRLVWDEEMQCPAQEAPIS
jgi:hypothetical protein